MADYDTEMIIEYKLDQISTKDYKDYEYQMITSEFLLKSKFEELMQHIFLSWRFQILWSRSVWLKGAQINSDDGFSTSSSTKPRESRDP